MAILACSEKANYSMKFFVLPSGKHILFSDVLLPPFPSLCCWIHESEQLSHQLTWGRQKKWSKLPKPSPDPVSLSHLSTSEQDCSALCPHSFLLRLKGILSYQQLIKDGLFLLISLPVEKDLFAWRQLWLPCTSAGWNWFLQQWTKWCPLLPGRP